MISLGDFTFPATAHGLRWSDEYDWQTHTAVSDYARDGALHLELFTRQHGRPLTLTGGREWAWITRADLDTLAALLDTVTVSDTGALEPLTLTLHDGREIPVVPRFEGDGPLKASALPIVRDSGPADPGPDALYVLEELRLLIVGAIVDPGV